MSDHLRMSDAERELAAADLGEHYAQGRLSVEEHAERLDRIWAARTRGELGPIFADLPGSTAAAPPTWSPSMSLTGNRVPPPPGNRAVRASRRLRGLPTPVVVLLVVLLTVTVLAHLPLILVGLAVWFLVRRAGCSTHGGRHPVRYR